MLKKKNRLLLLDSSNLPPLHLRNPAKGFTVTQAFTCNSYISYDWAKILVSRGQVDTFILNFEKAFDTPPHEPLKSKLFSYGINDKSLKWIDSFLCFSQQRVGVNGAKTDWAPVLSGVPQGTVLGPLLFSLYINDISSDIESEIRLFAYDCVLLS